MRFAPSPTGELHVGGARTALYNWLFARNQNGKFILRIEDTDQTRSTDEAIVGITSSLKWLGLNWDEGPEIGGEHGPYRQTERFGLYREWADKLITSGKAYYCYCLPEELVERRQQALKAGRSPQYDRRCRHLNNEERRKAGLKNDRPALRFAAPLEGETTVDDLIRGLIPFLNADVDDFIILRSDSTPTYNFVVVIDDALMKITHVIRGDDHLSNTPKQILLYQALGFPLPRFSHLSMILGPDKKPLSKRFGATSVEAFRDNGYLAEALLNYLALLGWSYDERTTLFTRDELIEKFSLNKVSKNPAIFDFSKLDWMNGHYLRQQSPRDLAQRLIPFLVQADLVKNKKRLDLGWLEKVVFVCQERIKTLNEFIELAGFFFRDEVIYEKEASDKVRSFSFGSNVLAEAEERLALLDAFQKDEIEKILRQVCLELKISPSRGLQPIRFAVTGRLVSPPLFETMELLGKEKSLKRLRTALESLSCA